MSVEDKIVDQLQCILELWEISYDQSDEKYIARTSSNVVLNPNQIENIKELRLSIFSVQKYDEMLVITFSAGGGYCT